METNYKVYLLDSIGDFFDGYNILNKTYINDIELDLSHPNYAHMEQIVELLNSNNYIVNEPNDLKLQWEGDDRAILTSKEDEPLFSVEVSYE